MSMKFIDLFAGREKSGGMTLGFQNAGFEADLPPLITGSQQFRSIVLIFHIIYTNLILASGKKV